MRIERCPRKIKARAHINHKEIGNGKWDFRFLIILEPDALVGPSKCIRELLS
jgi:hypothetical protein